MNLDAHSLSSINAHSDRARFREVPHGLSRGSSSKREKRATFTATIRPEIDAGKKLLSRRWRTKSSVKRVFSRKRMDGHGGADRERIFDNPRTLSEGRARAKGADRVDEGGCSPRFA